jgi:hypothetical protein
MSSHTIRRPATTEELALLQTLLGNAATTARRWRAGLENALVLWAFSLLIIVVAWLTVAWLVRRALGIDFGLQSPAAIWILGFATPACAAYAVFSSVRWVMGWKEVRPLLRADLAAAEVVEEHYIFDAAKRFQEPEHGGLFYFLRTPQGQVLTLYDPESQDLAMRDEAPFASSLKPSSRLVMVRAPETGWVISKAFTGEPLEVGDPVELDAAPERWPENEQYCSIPWSQLEAVLGPAALKAASTPPPWH